MTTLLDESLFGLKDFGYLTLAELKTHYQNIHGKPRINPIKYRYSFDEDSHFWVCGKDNQVGLDDTPVCNKYWQLKNNEDPEYRYRVQFELFHNGVAPRPPYTGDRAPYIRVFMHILIDGVSMNNATPDHRPWDYAKYENYATDGPIQYVNALHDKYLLELGGDL